MEQNKPLTIGEISERLGLQTLALSDDSIQFITGPLTKSDVIGGWLGRCGISRPHSNTNQWCVVFEVATFMAPEGVENIWATDVAAYLQYLNRFCADNYGFMSVTSDNVGEVTSRITWNVDVVRQIGVATENNILTLSGSVIFDLPAEQLMYKVAPIIHNLVNQVNLVEL